MKNINRLFSLTSIGFMAGILACSDPELPPADLGLGSTGFKANFTFANASADSPSLDFYVNGLKLGSGAPGAVLTGYTSIAITSSGAAGSATANTSIRSKATTDIVGGLIGSADLIYRSTSNGTNNFAALNGANYTVFAIDSLCRPVAKRLFRIVSPTLSVADITYWNPNLATSLNTCSNLMAFGGQISASRRDSLNPANCPSCVNWDAVGLVQNPSTAVEYANLVTIGVVPLGLTDVGGLRYYVVSDAPLTFTSVTALTNAGIRFVNAIANANGIVAAANANGTSGGPPLWARLRPAAGADIVLAASTTHVVNSASFNPTVGSRTAGNLAFATQAIAAAGVPIAYTLQVSTDNYLTIAYAAFVSFVPGKNYTVFVRGISGKNGSKGISHGIVSY